MRRWLFAPFVLMGICIATVWLRPPAAWRPLVRVDVGTIAGRQPLGASLIELGFRPEDFPATALFPPPAPPPRKPPAATADPAIRLAAVRALPRENQWAALTALAARHPESAAIQAALCRHAWAPVGPLRLGREREIDPAARVRANYPPAKSSDIAMLLASAESGAHLEPDNAFFPTIAAVACLATRRDDEGRALLHRAAVAAEWNEHLDFEVDGIAGSAAANGGDETLGPVRAARQAALLQTHYSAVRQAARLWIVEANRRETAGDVRAAMAIRRAVHAVGANLRAHGPTLIGNLVGSAVERIAQREPASLRNGKSSGRSALPDSTPARCIAWYEHTGDRVTARRWRSTESAAETIRQVVESSSDAGPYALSESALAISAAGQRWVALATSVWLAACAVVGVPLSRCAAAKHRRLGAAIAASFLIALGWSLARNAGGGIRDLIATAGMLEGLQGGENSSASTGEWVARLRGEATITLLLAAIPTVVVVVSGCLALGGKIGFVRAIALASAIASVIPAAAYLARLPDDSRADGRFRSALRQCVTREGPYISAKVGVAWPEP